MNILLASWQNESFGMAALSFINALKRQNVNIFLRNTKYDVFLQNHFKLFELTHNRKIFNNY